MVQFSNWLPKLGVPRNNTDIEISNTGGRFDKNFIHLRSTDFSDSVMSYHTSILHDIIKNDSIPQKLFSPIEFLLSATNNRNLLLNPHSFLNIRPGELTIGNT